MNYKPQSKRNGHKKAVSEETAHENSSKKGLLLCHLPIFYGDNIRAFRLEFLTGNRNGMPYVFGQGLR